MKKSKKTISIKYKNYEGVCSTRAITPKEIFFGETVYHRKPQWLLTAFCHNRERIRDFALNDIEEITQAGDEGYVRKICTKESPRIYVDQLEDRNDKLEEQLKEAEEVIGFYGSQLSMERDGVQEWCDGTGEYFGVIKRDFSILQTGSDSCDSYYGKTARQYLAKYNNSAPDISIDQKECSDCETRDTCICGRNDSE